jgi:hypothetical protein
VPNEGRRRRPGASRLRLESGGGGGGVVGPADGEGRLDGLYALACTRTGRERR